MKGHFQNKLLQRARFLFGGNFLPLSDKKKWVRLVQRIFVGKNSPKLPYFEGKNKLILPNFDHRFLHVVSI
jgi:hypothetical protein